MGSARLPAVRLPSVLSDGETSSAEGVLLPSSSKFGFTWTNEVDGSLATSPGGQSEGEVEDWSMVVEDQAAFQVDEATPETKGPIVNMFQPRFSRALSMPLPSQLGHLQNPHRTGSTSSSGSDETDSSQALSRFHELSLELADSVQMVIQTMLQISPPQVLDPAKEQFSACALAVPTPSMSAIFTTMKSLNYISANMATLCDPSTPNSEKDTLFAPANGPSNDFDIGELLQSVGDALSGSAAQAGVDLVLYHADVGMKHVVVRGDESGISFTLCHIVRQVLRTAKQGDSIELGLSINLATSQATEMDATLRRSASTEPEHPLQCVIDIGHKYATDSADKNGANESTGVHRDAPILTSTLLRRLLWQLDANLAIDLPPKLFTHGHVSQLKLLLERGTSLTSSPLTVPLGSGDEPCAREPSLEELAVFAETLRGKKGTLYASSKGSFAHHFASYLATWGMDVNHESSDTSDESDAHVADGVNSVADASANSIPPQDPTYGPHLQGYGPNGPLENHVSSLSFIFIDDNVSVLKERLQALRTEQRFNLTLKKRPPLTPHYRRSSPQLTRSLDDAPQPPAVVIVHFTSLSNFKIIKDMIQSMVFSYAESSSPLPEVMIIPKPAGPRRFLTALHTALTKPFVDPFFAPIATSPITPSVPSHSHNPFFPDIPSITSSQNRPSGSRTNSAGSTRSAKDSHDHHLAPSSPLARADNVEYFSQAADQFGTSPASGVVIQSPDGQPHGIFFSPPRGKTPRQPSGLPMERDKGQLTIRPQSPPQLGFSSLHEISFSTPNGKSPQLNSSASRPTLKKPISPRSEEFVVSNGGLPRKLSTAEASTRKSPPPSGSPLAEHSPTSPRRSVRRRSTQEPKQPTTKSHKKKGKGTDNIVPPVKVLIVEDNPINQTILSTFMKRKKITYDVAKDGSEAVEKWRTGGFHLILMDIQMPVMDGLQATKEIRRLEKTNALAGYPPTPLAEDGSLVLRTPSDASEARNSPYRSSVIIVALTASSLQSDRVTALAAGCNDFLTKPVSLEWLENKIIEWGSIKALQMWADLRPEVLRTISSGQSAQARTVADRLHVPKERTTTPSPSRLAQTSSEHAEASSSDPPNTSEQEDRAQAFAANVAGLMRSSSAPRRQDTFSSQEVPINGLTKPTIEIEQGSPIDLHPQRQVDVNTTTLSTLGAPSEGPKGSTGEKKTSSGESESKSSKPLGEAVVQTAASSNPPLR